jgi:hypothetical protein
MKPSAERQRYALSIAMPKDLAGRLAFVEYLLAGAEIYDENGDTTGERTAPLITKEEALRLLLETP